MRIFRKYHFKMKYWKIRTNEGNGVLHIVFRGKYILQKWLSKQWTEIHKSPIVDIKSLHETRKGLQGVVYYLIGNYLAKQSFERMSWGYSGVFSAFVSSWKRLVEKYGFKRGLELWNRLPCSPFIITRQVQLIRFLPEYERSNEKSLQLRAVFSIRPREIAVTRQKSSRFILTKTSTCSIPTTTNQLTTDGWIQENKLSLLYTWHRIHGSV